MSFHENLRTLRLARGQTQPALAEKAGIEQSYLSKLENGRSRPSEDVLTRLAQALEVKVEALQNGDEIEERTRRWQWGLKAAGLALVLIVAFFIGRATAVYPLSMGQIITGAGAAETTTQEILKLAPSGIRVIMINQNGHGGGHISISGNASGEPAVDAYIDAIRKRFGGSFIAIMISPNAGPGGMRDFSLQYVMDTAPLGH